MMRVPNLRVVLAAMVFAAPGMAHGGGTAATGEIILDKTTNGVRIAGQVVGHQTGHVSATLEISKSDTGGTTRIRQRGEFDVAAGSSDTVGLSEISVSAGGTVTVDFVLVDGIGTETRYNQTITIE